MAATIVVLTCSASALALANPRPYLGPSDAVAASTQAAPTAEPTPPARRPPSSAPQEVRKVRVKSRRPARSQPDRSGSIVSRTELNERLPRSAPDALRDEPGVYIQQTAHSQASPYVRGLTGQQTVMFFDGIRLNNSTFRQGPNQYFFTIDSRTIESLEVIRGSASTQYGSDALGGALRTTPIDPAVGVPSVEVHPRAIFQTSSADATVGGRGQVEVSSGTIGMIAGVGYRDVGQLRSGGPVTAPATDQPQRVPPAFEADGKTQRGTGFRELTADARLVWQPNRRDRLTFGYYDYRQFDAPRTDKCPPPTAPADECLTYDEQFRTMAYGAYEHRGRHAAAHQLRWTLSYQRQHEERTLRRGSPSTTVINGEDSVDSVGSSIRIQTRQLEVTPWLDLQVQYGADGYYDHITSDQRIGFTDVSSGAQELSRGQYVDGSHYMTSGIWAEVQAQLTQTIGVRAGGRVAAIYAKADPDLASETAGVNKYWVTPVGNAGISVRAVPWLTFLFNLDQGFRAPNLDDLTSRQQTGPGFQFENSDLDPERSLAMELGFKIQHPVVEIEGWAFQSTIRGLIQRAPREVSQCPSGDPACAASQTRFQLVNLDGRAVIRGADGGMRLYLPYDLHVRTTVSYARGEGPSPIQNPRDNEPDRRPLSRIPPLHGTASFGWRSERFGIHAFAAMRWAILQDRLSLQDRSDARIPEGGTPGYVVLDLRAGYRLDPYVLLSMVFENVADTAYRYHGSSVNGPGRGLIFELQAGF